MFIAFIFDDVTVCWARQQAQENVTETKQKTRIHEVAWSNQIDSIYLLFGGIFS